MDIYIKDLNSLKEWINHVHWRGRKATLLQHDSARPHHTVTSVVIVIIRFYIVPYPPYSLDLAPSDSWFLNFSRNISKKFISHVMKKRFWKQNEKFQTKRFKKVVQYWRCVKIEGYYVEKWGTETQYTLWAIFCVLFHFDNLSGCKGTNMEALLSKPPTYNHYWLDITLILRHNPIPLPLWI